MKELIKKFIKTCGTKVVPQDNVELFMNDHFCINYENVEYYLPENSILFTEDEDLLLDFIKYTYLI